MNIINKLSETAHAAIDNVLGESIVYNVDGWWYDHHGNRWSADRYNKDEAAVVASSLIRCWGCTDCENCIDCSNCRECYNCVDCDMCVSCRSCSGCLQCALCESCEECKHCCESTYSEHCTHCDQCDHVIAGVARQGKTMVSYVKPAANEATEKNNKGGENE